MEAEARYPEAAEEFAKALALNPQDEQLLRHQSRLNFVAVQLGRLNAYKTDAVQSALYRSALAYLGNSDADAVNQAGYALSLRPGAKDIGNYLAQIELTTGLKRKKAQIAPETAVKVEQLLTLASEAMEESRYEEAIYMSDAVLKYQPENIMAFENLGISRFARGEYQKSLEAWEKAYELETSQARLEMIDSQITSVENVIKQQKRKAAMTAATPAPALRAAKPVDTAEVQRLYREGLDLYSSGELEKARAIFQKVLETDPENVPAANAIKRIQRELKK
jgi:tetratricopeptide (TPR) repeat protein